MRKKQNVQECLPHTELFKLWFGLKVLRTIINVRLLILKKNNLIIMCRSVFVFKYNTQDTIYNNKHLQRSNLKIKVGNYEKQYGKQEKTQHVKNQQATTKHVTISQTKNLRENFQQCQLSDLNKNKHPKHIIHQIETNTRNICTDITTKSSDQERRFIEGHLILKQNTPSVCLLQELEAIGQTQWTSLASK